ncbi:FadR/GntR family transcriptional regulator [Conexibacter sp. JD483]|uniref:FadR/GntR family transcriptional regulator n=1 Tax=unclassified Conexibacter TaxID=2627773 RepID=UPI0027216178|nr:MULTISPECIES: FadR/GntR family transcriptional regulator [unclassified Conexibacter]MDO8187953.1 FadR/GntR family transcriptional regulator [Conexibacter sp. CPCC 205706]MDO8200178.1 FadR/GntR family transcriptional regulator [Conexibacter sp. CPCC 205762]MDR9369724.1 FadR/GntR family transcriptional regulator [Conexibacter sp. JD483]
MVRPAANSPFRPLNQLRAFEQIVVQIEDAIIGGRLQLGDRLPSEREMAETFGVSRASVREALRVLEMFGVVVARRGTGPEAGSVLAAETQSGLQNVLRLHAGLLRIPANDIVEVRAALERQVAEQAAVNATEESIVQLRELIDDMAEASTIRIYHERDTEFHVQLARASGNALLPVLMEALRGAMRRAMLDGFERLSDWQEERGRLLDEHRQIVDLIELREPEGAANALRAHVVRFYRHVMDDERRGPGAHG